MGETEDAGDVRRWQMGGVRSASCEHENVDGDEVENVGVASGLDEIGDVGDEKKGDEIMEVSGDVGVNENGDVDGEEDGCGGEDEDEDVDDDGGVMGWQAEVTGTW